MRSGYSEGLKFKHLKEANYYGWKDNMEAALKLKDLWGPVAESDAWKALEEEHRVVIDEKARSKNLITSCASANYLYKDAWTTIERVFHARSSDRKFSLRSQLHELKRGKSEGVLMHVARAEKIRTELKEDCNKDVSDDSIVHAILMGLGKAYEAFVRQVKFGTETFTLDDIKSRPMIVESEVKRSNR
jgi:gag-polypeptide of LTR copia-type